MSSGGGYLTAMANGNEIRRESKFLTNLKQFLTVHLEYENTTEKIKADFITMLSVEFSMELQTSSPVSIGSNILNINELTTFYKTVAKAIPPNPLVDLLTQMFSLGAPRKDPHRKEGKKAAGKKAESESELSKKYPALPKYCSTPQDAEAFVDGIFHQLNISPDTCRRDALCLDSKCDACRSLHEVLYVKQGTINRKRSRIYSTYLVILILLIKNSHQRLERYLSFRVRRVSSPNGGERFLSAEVGGDIEKGAINEGDIPTRFYREIHSRR